MLYELGKFVVFMENYYLVVAGLLFIVCIIALILNHITVKRHISLSNEQLDIIEQQFSDILYEEYKK